MTATVAASCVPPLARLLQLASPALPVGAYAYSRGLEQAIARGWVVDVGSAQSWVEALVSRVVAVLDAPLLLRFEAAFRSEDDAALTHWRSVALALRETDELALEDIQLGRSLARLLVELGVERAAPFRRGDGVSYASMFALACVDWGIPVEHALLGYFYAFVDSQVAAAIKLVPLGQTAGQQMLVSLLENLDAWMRAARRVTDEDVGLLAPGLAMASAWHETQYSRLFRS